MILATTIMHADASDITNYLVSFDDRNIATMDKQLSESFTAQLRVYPRIQREEVGLIGELPYRVDKLERNEFFIYVRSQLAPSQLSLESLEIESHDESGTCWRVLTSTSQDSAQLHQICQWNDAGSWLVYKHRISIFEFE